ncbi:MAG: serine/threonine protein kinase [Proteobacteria bacterium]|nr:serine/threonine protein kinase [Pseudomonadota bacterium]
MAQEQRFELVSTLGRGGMAEVFLGWMNSVGGLRRKVAIKRILPELIQKQGKLFQQMFVDEARLAFQLEHDNIVRVYDVGQTANTFFIVMEYIEGFDLKSIMEKLRASGTIFPLGVALYITLQVCAGLGYAHTLSDTDGKPLGLIHNDISPPNILIGRHGEVKVADFGLSDARSNNVATPDGMIKGKFAYISPESTKNPPNITSRSDIFSIGIVLWEMLAGRRLFQRDSDLDTFKAVRACEIPDLRDYRNDIPEALVKIVKKALTASPDERYQTCEEFYLDIASLATALAIPLNRYDLSWLVNDLAGNRWKEFIGEKVSEDVQKSLEDELGGMLPPGDAEMFAELVTGMSEVQVEETNTTAQKENANWLEDVFNDVGFDEGEVVFDKENKETAPEPKKETDPTKAQQAPAVPRKAAVSKPESKSNTPTPTVKPSKSAVTPIVREVSGMLPSSKSKLIATPNTAPQKPSYLVLMGAACIGLVVGIIFSIIVVMFAL